MIGKAPGCATTLSRDDDTYHHTPSARLEGRPQEFLVYFWHRCPPNLRERDLLASWRGLPALARGHKSLVSHVVSRARGANEPLVYLRCLSYLHTCHCWHLYCITRWTNPRVCQGRQMGDIAQNKEPSPPFEACPVGRDLRRKRSDKSEHSPNCDDGWLRVMDLPARRGLGQVWLGISSSILGIS